MLERGQQASRAIVNPRLAVVARCEDAPACGVEARGAHRTCRMQNSTLSILGEGIAQHLLLVELRSQRRSRESQANTRSRIGIERREGSGCQLLRVSVLGLGLCAASLQERENRDRADDEESDERGDCDPASAAPSRFRFDECKL